MKQLHRPQASAARTVLATAALTCVAFALPPLQAQAQAQTQAQAQSKSQTVWRCGNTYQEQPCPEGRAVQAQDPRSAAERERHDAQVARETKAGDAMQKARLRAEKDAPRSPVPPAEAQDAPEPNAPLFRARVQKPAKPAKVKKTKGEAGPATAAASAARR